MTQKPLNIDPKLLQAFFTEHMPHTGKVIEEYWRNDRAELERLLKECLDSGTLNLWAQSHFLAMWMLSSESSHEYTSPWDVL